MDKNENPLVGAPPTEIPLRNAPLIRVLVQVRFPLIASIGRPEFIGPFQEAIRAEYPTLRKEHAGGLAIGPQGVSSHAETIWRFEGPEDGWRVSLGGAFLTLETTQYSSRNDFIERFERVLSALKEHVSPQAIERLGVRYVDRIVGDALGQLTSFVRPEVTGALSTPLRDLVRQSLFVNSFTLPEENGELTARCGLLPENATMDPSVIEPAETKSWVLDLDAYVAHPTTLDAEIVAQQTRRLAERIYAVFRWVVTEEFLRSYGAEL